MTDQITRKVFLRRAAAGGSILTVPGLLAACGGGSSGPSTAGGSTVPHKLAKTLHFSNWTLYIDKKGNAFVDESDPYGLSKVAKQFIAGQLAHARSLCGVSASVRTCPDRA